MQFYALRANAGGSQVVLLLFALASLAGDWLVLEGIVSQALAENYPTAEATVTRSHLVEHRGSKGGKSYSLDLAYEYVVDGRRYTGTRRRYYDMSTSNRAFWSQIQASLSVGRRVPVSYNPSDPSDAILTPGVEGTDWVRALIVLPLSLLLVSMWTVAARSSPEFDSTSSRFVSPTDSGWEARLPETSHLRVFLVTTCGLAVVSGFVLSVAHAMYPPPALAGAVFAGSIAVGAVAAVLFARYPTLVADFDAGELVLPAGWLGEPAHVPIGAISSVKVVSELKSAGRGKKYEVFRVILTWGDDADHFRENTLATYVRRADAEELATWVEVGTGRAPVDGTSAPPSPAGRSEPQPDQNEDPSTGYPSEPR